MLYVLDKEGDHVLDYLLQTPHPHPHPPPIGESFLIFIAKGLTMGSLLYSIAVPLQKKSCQKKPVIDLNVYEGRICHIFCCFFPSVMCILLLQVNWTCSLKNPKTSIIKI